MAGPYFMDLFAMQIRLRRAPLAPTQMNIIYVIVEPGNKKPGGNFYPAPGFCNYLIIKSGYFCFKACNPCNFSFYLIPFYNLADTGRGACKYQIPFFKRHYG